MISENTRGMRHSIEAVTFWHIVDITVAKNNEFNMDMLEEIVRTDNKQRYSFNEDKT